MKPGSRNLSFFKRLDVQLSLLLTAIVVLTIGYFSYHVAEKQIDVYKEQLSRKAEVVAENLSASVAAFVITKDFSQLDSILRRASHFDSIRNLQVLDRFGRTLSDFSKNEDGESVPRFDISHYELPEKEQLTISHFDNEFVVIEPINLGELVGWVRITYGLDVIRGLQYEVWIDHISDGVIIILIIIGSLLLVLKRPMNFIKRYTDFSDRLDECGGELITIDQSSNELYRLGSALNRASTSLFQQQNALQELLKDMERIAAISQYSPDIVLSVNADHNVDYYNTTADRVCTDLFGSADRHTIKKILPQGYMGVINKCLEQNTSYDDIESEAAGHIYVWKFAPYISQQLVHCHAIDITERKRAEEKIVRQANYDTLTELPNRVLAFDRINHAVLQAKREKKHVGVIFVDIDRFKVVNDTMGHNAGDEVIVQVAERLKSCVRDSDTVARFGGDEFVFILNELTDVIHCKVVAEKILEVSSEKYVIEGKEFYLGASIGIAAYPEDGEDANRLIRNADVAMYKAKDAGRNVYRFYSPEFNQHVQKRVEMEMQLRNALDKSELYLNFQPQYDIQNNRLVGAEALIRWKNNQLGFVSPDRFISLAEDTGMILSIGEWVLRTACEHTVKWNAEFSLNLRIAVNVSPRQFMEADFVSIVRRVLEDTGLSAQQLELEITESLLVEDAYEVLDTIKELKTIGVSLALDDFGTGYSSLSYLKRFPFDILKIDRAFISDVIDNPEDAALCQAIAAIASSLDLEVIGEGVETEEQLQFLKNIGVEMIQGYYYSKPLDAEQFNRFLSE